MSDFTDTVIASNKLIIPNGAFQIGGFLVTPAGQITIGKGINIVGPSLIPFDAGTAKIVIGQTNYTKYLMHVSCYEPTKNFLSYYDKNKFS